MKLLAKLLIAISLAVGLGAASSAYLADLASDDAQLIGLTVNENVKRLVEPDELERIDVAKKGTTLDAATIAALRQAEANRVRVEEFALVRWNERWIFLFAMLGLGAGAFLMRRASAAEIAEQQAQGEAGGRRAPGAELADIERIVAELLEVWPQRVAPHDDARYVLERLSVAIEDHGPAFVASRELLVARMGLGGYASVMDRFAGAERQIHRAWSAAADGVLEETHVCLQRARVVLAETREALGSHGG